MYNKLDPFRGEGAIVVSILLKLGSCVVGNGIPAWLKKLLSDDAKSENCSGVTCQFVWSKVFMESIKPKRNI
jgi:hypothetical protein